MDDINLGLCLHCGASQDSFSLAVATSLPTPCLPPTHTLSYAGPKLVRTLKNNLKLPKIKQVTNSKLYYIKLNISISTILLNKAGLTRGKAGYTNHNF